MSPLRRYNMYPTRYIAFVALIVCLPSLAWADENRSQRLILPDRTVAEASIVELEDNSQIRFSIDGKATSFPFNTLCRFGVHPIPQRFPVAVLTDGSCLAITSIERSKDQFILQTKTWENVSIPESLLRAVVVAPSGSSTDWFALYDRVCNASGRNDQLLLGTRGWTDGILQWPESTGEILTPDGSQKFRINSEDVDFPVKEIEAIVFSPILTPMSNLKLGGRIGWKDGSLLSCSQWRIAQPGDYVEVTLRCGAVLKSLDQPAAVAYEMVSLTHRPKEVTFLSDLEASSYKHVDWLTSKWPLGKDRDLLGRRLLAKSGIIDKGLAMHATSQAAFRWDKSPARLTSSITLAQPAESGLAHPGQAVAKVMGLKGGKLEALYTSPLISSETPEQDFSLSLEGVELIVLIVDAGLGGTLGDHILWLDTRIQK